MCHNIQYELGMLVKYTRMRLLQFLHRFHIVNISSHSNTKIEQTNQCFLRSLLTKQAASIFLKVLVKYI